MSNRVKGNISNVNETDFMGGAGTTYDITLPSGKSIKMRERNGDDEDVISRTKDARDGMSIPNFLSKLIMNEPTPPSTILKWKVRDKYYLLFKERLFTWGNEITFDHKFSDGETYNFTEDLSKFDWDFTDPNAKAPAKGEKGYEAARILPYDSDKPVMEGRTSSGKNFRMKYLTSELENKSLAKDQDSLSINDKIRIREFELQDAKGNWHRIEVFNMLSARDMQEIRKLLLEKDGDFDLTVEVKHPNKNIIELVSLMNLPDFFFQQA